MPNYLSSRLRRLASALQRHFVIALLTGVVLGFVVPGLEHVPPPVMVVFLGVLIFVSAFRITLGEMRRIDPVRTALFYLVRFPVLSALLWTITGLVSPALATGVLLLTLAPSGVASPGVAGIYRGNVSLTIVIVVVSSFLAPFMIPLVLELFVARQVEIQTFAIFQTLVVSVIVPIVAHIPLRRFPVADDIRANDSLVVVPAIATLVMLVIAGQKEFIIAHAGEALGFFVTAIILFFGYYAFGWWIYPRSVHRDRIAYALSSGVNNTAIVIVLAYLYFSPEVVTFLVTSELAWVGSMVAFKHLVQRLDHATTG
ncbi:MAG: bile acid:sodium symporter family protein [Alkalispirochaeta sp.]